MQNCTYFMPFKDCLHLRAAHHSRRRKRVHHLDSFLQDIPTGLCFKKFC